MTWQDACALADLDEGTPAAVRVGTLQVVLLRRGDAVHAMDALCPHKFGPMEEAHIEGDCIVCPLHDAHFHLESGEPRDGDGWAGTLGMHATRVVDGQVQVSL